MLRVSKPRERNFVSRMRLSFRTYIHIRAPELRCVLRRHVVFINGTRQNCGTRAAHLPLSLSLARASGRRVLIFLTPCTSSQENCAPRVGPSKPRAFPRNKLPSDRRGRSVHFEEPRASTRKTSLCKMYWIHNAQFSNEIQYADKCKPVKNIRAKANSNKDP